MLECTDEARWDAAQEGAELVREGELGAAVVELKARISEDSDNPYAYFFLGAALFEQGELLPALKAYLHCVELSPEYLGALVAVGRTLHALGRHDEALRVGRQILQKSKDDADALHLMGMCHFARGESAAAELALTKFLETGPELEVALEVEGMLEVLRGGVQEAAEALDD